MLRKRQGWHIAPMLRVWGESELVLSDDEMKVTLLTMMPLKDAIFTIFTRRPSCFNETFAVLMPAPDKEQTMPRRPLQQSANACVVLHEALAGRGAAEVAAAYCVFLESSCCVDKEQITIWADNCAAQNKSWALVTALLKVVHSDKTNT